MCVVEICGPGVHPGGKLDPGKMAYKTISCSRCLLLLFFMVQCTTSTTLRDKNTTSVTPKSVNYKACKITTGVFAAIGFFIPCLCACFCGFGCCGIRGGSCASGYQSSVGNIEAGSCFSSIQGCMAGSVCTLCMLIPSALCSTATGVGMWYLCIYINDHV